MIETIEIRPGTVEDVSKAVPLVQEFVAETMEQHGFEMQPEYALDKFAAFVDNSVVAFDGDRMVGLIAGKLSEMSIGEQQVFQEQVWFVSKDYRTGIGSRILTILEARLRNQGISFLIMVHLGGERSKVLERFYKNQGYQVMETHYFKKL